MVVFRAPTPRFTPKYEWVFKNNIICGFCIGAWLQTLWECGWHVQWLRYWQRVAFVSAIAVFNSCLAVVECLLYGGAIARQKVHPRPVFVLGHPRTGTTLLHNLLAKDTETFGICSTFCAGFPSSFLWFERFKWILAGMVDSKRPMDNMPLSLDVPQEDELAVNVLSAGASPYMPLAFMTAEPSFRPFFTFDEAPPHLTARWHAAFMHFLRKLSVRCGGRRLLLKSPVHTARVALLRRLFPDAQFVYIHRHPEAVYKSACHMADTTYWYSYLARPTDEQVHEFILSQFVTLWDEYDKARAAVPDGNLVEVSYDELVADPVATVGRIYERLGIGGFEGHMRERVAAAAARPAVKEYKVNRLGELPPDLRERVARRWAAYTKAWGYEW